jgi:hypothetical protein
MKRAPGTVAAPRPEQRDRPASATGESCLYGDWAALPADVQALLDAAGATDFQASAAWWTNFVQTVDLAGAVPQLRVWREGGRALAALPLLLHRPAGRVTALGNYYTTRYAPLLASGVELDAAVAALRGILASLLRDEPGVHTLRFEPLEAGSLAETALHRALQQQGCAVFGFHAFRNWLLPVRSDWPTYLATRDGPLRTTLARMGKRFAARGGRLELVQGISGRLEDGIQAYQTVYAGSWKEPEPHPQFMPGLIRAAARNGVLRLGIAWLGEVPVAAQVWMVAGGRADIYKLAHDERHKESSPGTLLTAMLMQHAFEQDRVALVDYLSGDDGYKRLWMSEVRQRTGLVAYRLGRPRGWLGAAREQAGRWLRARRPKIDAA